MTSSKITTLKLKYIGASGTAHEVLGYSLSATVGAIIEPNEKFAVLHVLSGRKLYAFDTLTECSKFVELVEAHKKLYLGDPDLDATFSRAGGRVEFIKALQSCIDKARS